MTIKTYPAKDSRRRRCFWFVAEPRLVKSEKLPDRQWPMRCTHLLNFSQPSPELLDGVEHPVGPNATHAAEKIFSIYNETVDKLVL